MDSKALVTSEPVFLIVMSVASGNNYALTIAKKTGLAEPNTHKYLKLLVKNKLLKRNKLKERRVTYSINWKKIQELVRFVLEPIAEKRMESIPLDIKADLMKKYTATYKKEYMAYQNKLCKHFMVEVAKHREDINVRTLHGLFVYWIPELIEVAHNSMQKRPKKLKHNKMFKELIEMGYTIFKRKKFKESVIEEVFKGITEKKPHKTVE